MQLNFIYIKIKLINCESIRSRGFEAVYVYSRLKLNAGMAKHVKSILKGLWLVSKSTVRYKGCGNKNVGRLEIRIRTRVLPGVGWVGNIDLFGEAKIVIKRRFKFKKIYKKVIENKLRYIFVLVILLRYHFHSYALYSCHLFRFSEGVRE